MSYPVSCTQSERYFSMTQAYSNILSCFKLGRSVHPVEPVAPIHSEFLEVASRRRIRIIHIKPESADGEYKFNKKHTKNNESKRRSFRLSTEEYWFTRWNRPLRSAVCNCSFRRSKRFSKYSDRLSISSIQSPTNINSFNFIPKAPSLDSYVEKLISDVFFAAFKEYSIISAQCAAKEETPKPSGIVNFAYANTEDEVNLNYLLNQNANSINNNSSQSKKVQSNISTANEYAKEEQVVHRDKRKKSGRKECNHGSTASKNTKPMVLLLHGIGSSAEIWWDVLQCLVCAGYEVLAPDMLGHGYSSVPDCAKAYTFSKLLQDILAVFDKYVSSTELGQCIVIGHSFGCSLAGALARYREQQVVQLVLISGGGPTPLAPPVTSTEISMFSCMQILMKPLLFCGMKRTMFYSSRGKHFEVCDVQSAVPPHVLRYISEGQQWPEGDAAFHRRILIPTLLVHGLQDTNVTLVQECEMERTIPRSFLEVIPAAGHMAMMETPEQLCHMLLCFFQWWSK